MSHEVKANNIISWSDEAIPSPSLCRREVPSLASSIRSHARFNGSIERLEGKIPDLGRYVKHAYY